MTNLSPAAQAVMNAWVENTQYAPIDNEPFALAAALRAAADQADPKTNIEDINYTHQNYVDGWKDAIDVILVIATELEDYA